jgi:dihydroflavonol-4-reductase
VWPLAIGAEALARVTGREPFVSRDALRMARYKMFFDDAKARREIGHASRPYTEGLRDAVAWFRQAGYVR